VDQPGAGFTLKDPATNGEKTDALEEHLGAAA
jgi:hypothetical protein